MRAARPGSLPLAAQQGVADARRSFTLARDLGDEQFAATVKYHLSILPPEHPDPEPQPEAAQEPEPESRSEALTRLAVGIAQAQDAGRKYVTIASRVLTGK